MNLGVKIYLYIFEHKVYIVFNAIERLDKARKYRIKQTKLRIFVENNGHVNITNYWYYRYFNKQWLK